MIMILIFMTSITSTELGGFIELRQGVFAYSEVLDDTAWVYLFQAPLAHDRVIQSAYRISADCEANVLQASIHASYTHDKQGRFLWKVEAIEAQPGLPINQFLGHEDQLHLISVLCAGVLWGEPLMSESAFFESGRSRPFVPE